MSKILKKDELLEIQKNVDPFLMMDEVEIVSENKVVGKKKFDEKFSIFRYHWPGDPNVPAAYQIETMSQVASIIILSRPEHKKSTFLVVAADKLKFKKKILPNNTLTVEANLKSFKRGLASFEVRANLDNNFCCSGQFTMILQEEYNKFL